jgi:hypothetical protein
MQRVVGIRQQEVGVPTIDIEAGEAGLLAEVFLSPSTELALSAGAVQPGDPGPLAQSPTVHPFPEPGDHADHLMPRRNREPRRLDVTLGQMQIGVTDPAGLHPQQQLAGARQGIRPLS